MSSLAPKQAMGWRGKHEAGSQVKSVPGSRREMPGPEGSMQEAPRAARVARACTAFGDRTWVGGGAQERRGAPPGCGAEASVLSGGDAGDSEPGREGEGSAGTLPRAEVSEKGHRSQARGRWIPSGRFSLGTC